MTLTIPRRALERKRAELRGKGVVVPEGDTGRVEWKSADGMLVAVSFRFRDPDQLQLNLVQNETGWPEFVINGRVKEWFSI